MSEEDIFKEWYEMTFDVIPDPLEYIYYRDSLGFQRYLVWYRYRELVDSIKWDIFNALEKLLSMLNNIRKRWKK